jgi:cyclopropane-fatty-acyl-phospholipid synthase
MGQSGTERTAREIFSFAGIEVGGTRPWDIQVNDPGVYKRLLAEGSLGLGETYMDGGWDCDEVDEFICRVLRAGLDMRVRESTKLTLQVLRNKITNPQTVRRAREVGRKHYDVGNDLYATMLDDEMTYTCGYWKDADTLDAAQQAKLKLVCDKIGLEKGMRVLDIGCGWGSFARYAAKHYGAEIVGITISKEQVALAKERCRGLPIEIRFQDYREVGEKFDRVVSLGMFEHVGPKNYREYMRMNHRCLNDGGVVMLHTIVDNITKTAVNPWIEKYIFPRGKLPSLKEITASVEGLFVVEDCHNFGTDYDKTLMAWHKNFNAGWDSLKDRYDERFRRMWNFYLLSCAGGFRARDIQLWQVVLSKGGIPGGYRSIR